MANVVYASETVAAQAFLKAIGANYQSTDMIYAVVAWMRTSEGGRGNLWGNNPFNLKVSALQLGYVSRSLVKGTKYRAGYGTLLIFGSLTNALKATAQYLKATAAGIFGASNGYRLILKAFKTGNPVDALTAIALSAWDAAHYGYDIADPDPNHALAQSHIYKVYAAFTGLQMPTPKAPPPEPPRPKPPRDLPAPPPAHPYINPDEAGRFYQQRHRQSPFLE